MAKRRRSSIALSGRQAQAALAVLIQEGRLAAGEVWKALARRGALIRALKAKLSALEQGAARISRQFENSPFPITPKGSAADDQAKRKKPRFSAATRKLYQQQGRYLAALRPLSKEQRAKVKA